ncbi:hypothetical protein Tco_0069263, partial [Tanacetum coccineum]
SQQLVNEFVDEGTPLTDPRFGDLEADTQKAIKESLKDAHGAHRGPLPPVVFRETDTGKFQPLPEAGPNPGNDTVSQTLSTPGVHAGPNLEHTDAEATDATSQPQPRQIDEEFTATAYPNTTADTEAESIVSVTIHQDTFAIPHMTSPVIDLVFVPDSPVMHRPLPTTITVTAITTTTIITTIPLPPQPQQVSSDSILINRRGELEQHIADLVYANQALEERLDKHGSRLYRLESCG